MTPEEFLKFFDKEALENVQKQHDRLLDAHALAVASHVAVILLTTGFRPNDQLLLQMIAPFAPDEPNGQFHKNVALIVKNTLDLAARIDRMKAPSSQDRDR